MQDYDQKFVFHGDNVEIKPLTSANWADFEKLFGPSGAYGGCWCMWWRISHKECEAGKGEANKQALKSLVMSGIVPGLLAYRDNKACGWCSVAPREQFKSLERSPVLKRIDDKKVWSLVCFFIDPHFRGHNLALHLIDGAIAYVKSQNGRIIEAYPSILKSDNASPVTTYMGIPSVLEQAGFKEVHRPSAAKIIMRYYI